MTGTEAYCLMTEARVNNLPMVGPEGITAGSQTHNLCNAKPISYYTIFLAPRDQLLSF